MAVNREYTEHVYYQSANLRRIPRDYHEYGVNISRRWQVLALAITRASTCNSPVRGAAEMVGLVLQLRYPHFQCFAERGVQGGGRALGAGNPEAVCEVDHPAEGIRLVGVLVRMVAAGWGAYTDWYGLVGISTG